ncbi:MAG: glutaminyl-peptide cyclotransferase [Gammaproteobacteria bacterium]|nr:glutaminyl-peptide cyclotransferase [Gammaproteobacteria bacterium]
MGAVRCLARRLAFFLLLLLGPANSGAASCSAPAVAYEVVAHHDHDPTFFTQGLAFTDDGTLLEGTGRYGRSLLTARTFPGDEALVRIPLAHHHFGEGVTALGERVYQLTWKAGEARVYRLPELEPMAVHAYEGEGWGLSHDGEHLITSDGSHELALRDPDDFSLVRRLAVHLDGRPLQGLNELEYVAGTLYANVWPTDCIARIDATSGRVTGMLDLSLLRRAMPPLATEAVANGVAFQHPSGHLLVTGKLWPRLFELRLQDP